MTLPNLIIIGSIKGGTTSVFRYLADHPDVCASSLKEINFFFRFRDEMNSEGLGKYAGYFRDCSPDHKVRLEASPVYQSGGRWIAERIMKVMPDAKIVLIVREPVARYLSHVNFWVAKTNYIPPGTSVAQAVTDGLREEIEVGELHKETDWQGHATQLVRAGCYFRSLESYLEVVPKDQMCVLFFEDLARAPKDFMQRLCHFACIEGTLYENYAFSVENKTRIVRFKGLHRAIIATNNYLQPILNRVPAVRKSVRSLYFLLNRESGAERLSFSDQDIKPLVDFYDQENDKLRLLLKATYPEIVLPDWLEKA